MNDQLSLASLGDLCVDIYATYKKTFLGGTAFNTAIHAAKAGVQTGIFSSVGTDVSAEMFLDACKKNMIDTSHIKVLQGETSSIKVNGDDYGQRSFSEWELGVLKAYCLQTDDQRALAKYAVAKITLFKPLQNLFDQFIHMHLPTTRKVVDFAGSSPYSEDITVIQRYINHCDIVIKSLEKKDTHSLSLLQQLSVEHKGKIILALLGEKGSLCFLDGKFAEQPAIKTEVKDTNGAGDAFIAHFLIAYLKKRDIPQALLEGSKAASEEVRNVGVAG